MRGSHFAYVLPVVGDVLAGKRVAVVGLAVLEPVVRYLAASGVGRWLWYEPDGDEAAKLQRYLTEQHGAALGLEPVVVSGQAALSTWQPDLVIGCGNREAAMAATDSAIPVLWVDLPQAGLGCCATVVFAGEAGIPEVEPVAIELDEWQWAVCAPLCAGLARALLLRGTPFARHDLEALWAEGIRCFVYGMGGDPLRVDHFGREERKHWRERQAILFQTPKARRGRVLVVGLGSLGSVAALHLAPYVERMVLIDPDRVDRYNPVRQAYPLRYIGEAKTEALAAQIGMTGQCSAIALMGRLRDEARVMELVQEYGITAALVATGTADDFAIARGLHACGVPHVVGRCYARARYWEAILVDPGYGRGCASYEQIRSGKPIGPAPALTPEQLAAYSAAGVLEAEPATLVESGWAAIWMARLLVQLSVPVGLRERWLLELMADQATCLIGGVGVEWTEDGPAYGVEKPGQLCAWQRWQINSVQAA